MERNLFQVKRPIFSEAQFADSYEISRPESPFREVCSNRFQKACKCSKNGLIQLIYSVLPCLKWLPKYKIKEHFVKDLSAGLTVGIMQIPQGMAYAMLTTLPPVYGLYVSFIPVLTYFLFGTSRHVSVGTFAIICLMVGEVVENRAIEVPMPKTAMTNASQASNSSLPADSDDYMLNAKVQVAIALSLSVGIIQVLMGIVRLGFVTVYLSDPMISGFTTGAAFHIFSSQVRHFLGLTLPGSETRGFFSLFKIYIYLFSHLKNASLGAFLIGFVCTVLLIIMKYVNEKFKAKLKFPIPGELIVVVLGTSISYACNFHGNFGVPILESVPKGVPAPSLPSMSVMKLIVVESFTIAVVTFAINVSLVKSFARKNNYPVDPNQELVAYGASNIAGSFFSCFPSAVSLSRSLIQESLGSTQLTGVISVVLVILVLLSMAPLFEPLPKAVLSAIVLVALKGLFKQFKVLHLLWKVTKIDAFIWFASFLAVFCLGVDYGLAIGLAITLLSTVARTSSPSFSLLGQVHGTDLYRNIERFDVKEVPGIKILQYHASLYYANVEHFRETVFQMTVDPKIAAMLYPKENDSDNPPTDTDSSDTESETNDPSKEIEIKTLKVNARRRTKSLTITSNGVTIADEPMEDVVYNAFNDNSSADNVNTIILDCSQLAYADSMGVSTLANIVTEYKKLRISFYFANCSDNLLDMLDSGGFVDVHGQGGIFLTVHDAVLHALRKKMDAVYPDPPSMSSFASKTEHSRDSGNNKPKKTHGMDNENTAKKKPKLEV